MKRTLFVFIFATSSFAAKSDNLLTVGSAVFGIWAAYKTASFRSLAPTNVDTGFKLAAAGVVGLVEIPVRVALAAVSFDFASYLARAAAANLLSEP